MKHQAENQGNNLVFRFEPGIGNPIQEFLKNGVVDLDRGCEGEFWFSHLRHTRKSSCIGIADLPCNATWSLDLAALEDAPRFASLASLKHGKT